MVCSLPSIQLCTHYLKLLETADVQKFRSSGTKRAFGTDLS